jgi:hypothetical protein
MDDRSKVEKWEHVEELRLWLQQAMALSIDFVSRDHAKAFFVHAFLPTCFGFVSFRYMLIDV